MNDAWKVLLAGVSPLLVAIAGLIGVLITQARADARGERIASAARNFDRDNLLVDQRREACAALLTAVYQLTQHARAVMPVPSQFWDAPTEMKKEILVAQGKVAMLCGPEGRVAGESLIRKLRDYVRSRSKEDATALGVAEDAFVTTVGG